MHIAETSNLWEDQNRDFVKNTQFRVVGFVDIPGKTGEANQLVKVEYENTKGELRTRLFTQNHFSHSEIEAQRHTLTILERLY